MKKISKTVIWFDGKIRPNAQVPFLSHSLHYGSGVFEGIRFYQSKNGRIIFRLTDHLKRLFFSAKVMGMIEPKKNHLRIQNKNYRLKDLEKIIIDLVKKSKIKEGYIRPLIFYGEKIGLNPKNLKVHLAVAVIPFGKYLPKEMVKLKIVPWRRLSPLITEVKAKISGHYVNSVLAILYANKFKADEALLLDLKGNIAECSGENIFFVKEKTLFTPLAESILPGITRATVIQLAKDLGLKVKEKNISIKEIKSMDECFLVGTAAEITPVSQIEKINYGHKPGYITSFLQEIYSKLVRGEIKKYFKWLTFLN